MKSDMLIPVFFLLAALSSPAQEIFSFTLTPAPGKPSGTFVAALKAALTPGVDYIIEDSPNLTTWNQVSPLLRPPGGVLEWNHAQNEPLPWAWREPLYQTTESNWDTRRFYRVRALPPADAVPQQASIVPRGRLWRPDPEGPFFLTTKANWRVIIAGQAANAGYVCTITSPDLKVTYQFWDSGVHENLNGKHLKDRFGDRRTILLPGDIMITFTNGRVNPSDEEMTIKTISIYDADQTHRLNVLTNTVEMSVLLTRVGEAAEADGETMRIWHVGGGCYYAENIYTQDESGDGTSARQEAVPLGSTGGDANPNQVNDLFDDPRLGHT